MSADAYTAALAKIAEYRAVEAAGTPGPWRNHRDGDFVGFDDAAGFFRLFQRHNWGTKHDTTLAVLSRNALGPLVDLAEATVLDHAMCLHAGGPLPCTNQRQWRAVLVSLGVEHG